MLEAEAKCYELSAEAQISSEAILSLIELLESSMNGLRFEADPGCEVDVRDEQICGDTGEGGDGNGG